jgi:lactoylglutathione lyase
MRARRVEPSMESPVKELRVAVLVDDYDGALRLYRDALGLPVIESWDADHGSGAILDAGRATLELLSRDQVRLVDGVETDGTQSPPIRLALEVEDSVEAAARLERAGAERLGGPVVTPWNHRNVRLRDPQGTQLTLFTVLDD